MEEDFFDTNYEEFRDKLENLNAKELEKYKTIAEIGLNFLAESGDISARVMITGNKIVDKITLIQNRVARQDFDNEEMIEKYHDLYMQLYLEIDNFMKENDIKEN